MNERNQRLERVQALLFSERDAAVGSSVGWRRRERLVSVLMAVLGLAATINGQTDGPIARTLAREAARATRERMLTLDQSSANPSAARHSHLHDWSNVRHVVYSSEIIVRVKAGGIVRGVFVSADDSELLLTDDAGRMERIARADVAEVKVVPRKTFDSIARRAYPYALIGMAGGIAAAVGYCRSNDCQGQGVLTGAVFAMLGGMAGEGVGVVVAIEGSNARVIYRTP